MKRNLSVTSNAKSSIATAPYNFVPLNKNVYRPETQEVFFDHYDKDRNTGFIDITVTNETPLFIRGNEDKFLQVDDKPIIPGSSFRGMIRTMVEIIGYSKIQFINDSRFYYRTFLDKAKRLENDYKREILSGVKAGILYKSGRNYYLMPSTYEKIDGIKTKPECNLIDGYWHVYTGNIKDSDKHPIKNKNYLIKHQTLVKSKNNQLSKDDTNKYKQLVLDYENDKNRQGSNVLSEFKYHKHQENGRPIFYQTDRSGKITSFGNTLNYRLPYHKTVKDHLPPEHIEDNPKFDLATLIFGITAEKRNGNEKEKEITLSSRVYFEDLKCKKPVFENDCILKILSGPKPNSFQLYLKQPKGVKTPPDELLHWNDSVAIIRGYKNYWHRVSTNSNNNGFIGETFEIHKEEFEKFLQKVINLNKINEYISTIKSKFNIIESNDNWGHAKLIFKGDLGIYDIKLRDLLKTYFFLDNKQRKKYNLKNPQYSYIKPLHKGNEFKGRIRFENLTDEELGSLLFALELPEKCRHKVGLGKPLGLGSIKVQIDKLFLDDKLKRYSQILNNDGTWYIPEINTHKDFKGIFTNDILNFISSSEKDIWKTERLQELYAMLYFDENQQSNENWLNMTCYMVLKDFKDRAVLDTACNIKTKNLK